MGYLGFKFCSKNQEEALKIAKVNYYGLIPWINSITTDDRLSKPGSIWIFSSVAGDIGRPSNFHYGAAKSALTNYGQGLFYRCIGKPFKVRVIKAGLVNTSMSISKYPKILLANKNYIAKTLLKTI